MKIFISAILLSISLCIQAYPYRVVAYVAGWNKLKADSIPAEKLTHINYAFANVNNGEVVSDPSMPDDSANLAVLVSLKKRNPDLKILISVGGWTWSKGFSDAALTDSSRERFANSALQYMLRYKLDGIDIDWEFPGEPGIGNTFRHEDKENFNFFLQSLRKKLDEQSDKEQRIGNNRYLLTIAAGATHKFISHTQMHIAHTYLDFINLMTYDFHGEWEKLTGHHSNLYHSALDGNFRFSIDKSVGLFTQWNIPSRKIVIGAAFYGRAWTGVENMDNGVCQYAEKGKEGNFSYKNLKANYINKNGYVRYWDKRAKANYLWNAKECTFISYDDKKALRKECRYIKKHKFGGMMFWEYSNDDQGELTGLISRKL